MDEPGAQARALPAAFRAVQGRAVSREDGRMNFYNEHAPDAAAATRLIRVQPACNASYLGGRGMLDKEPKHFLAICYSERFASDRCAHAQACEPGLKPAPLRTTRISLGPLGYDAETESNSSLVIVLLCFSAYTGIHGLGSVCAILERFLRLLLSDTPPSMSSFDSELAEHGTAFRKRSILAVRLLPSALFSTCMQLRKLGSRTCLLRVCIDIALRSVGIVVFSCEHGAIYYAFTQ